MPIYYVATRARYTLVEAANEKDARKVGQIKLGCSRDQIVVVRLATAAEIELQQWDQKMRA